MKMPVYLTTALLLLSLAVVVPAVAQNTEAAQKYVPVIGYDPNRNAEQDLLAAQAEAKHSGRRVLLEVGGKWCSWCRIMDNFFREHHLAELRDRNFVTVPVNFSPENENKRLLGRYPKIPGYPHLFVLDADGKLLHSQNTSELEEGRGYNLTRFRSFLLQWAPGAEASKDTAGSH
jgi:thiol:disulfide interchange protein